MPFIADEAGRRAIERALARIALPSNRDLVRTYLGERAANGLKVGTLINDLTTLRSLCDVLGSKRLEDATKPDLVEWINRSTGERTWRSVRPGGDDTVTRRSVSVGPRTMAIRRVIVRLFFRWLRGTEDYPPEVRFLRVSRPSPDALTAEETLSPDEVRALIQIHPSWRDQAVFALLYESGFRAGEFCALNVGSVTFFDGYAKIVLPRGAPGLKTGPREILVFESVPYLQRWLSHHPKRRELGSPLFGVPNRQHEFTRLTNARLYHMCHQAAARAGLPKKVHPHMFRHTAATERARQGWSETKMRAFFGWTRSSDMPSHYVHLAVQDFHEMELERRGLLKAGPRSQSALAALECRVCHTKNAATALFCEACRNPVSPEAVSELDRRRREEEAKAYLLALAEASRSLTSHTLVVPPLQPVPGVTGTDLEREHLEWLGARTTNPGLSHPRHVVRPVRVR